jgi:hypothetical protein
MKYIKLYEGFKELEFIHTDAYKDYVKNKFNLDNVDSLLDHRSKMTKLINDTTDKDLIGKYEKEIKAIDYILKKHIK